MPLPDLSLFLWTLLVVAVGAGVWVDRTRARKMARLPPGPNGLPFVGNLLDLEGDAFCAQAHQWSKEYSSDVVSVTTLGHTTIILNSAQAVNDLFVVRESNYSDRPDMPMVIDLVGWDWTFTLMRYGPRWKEYRRIFRNQFNPTIKDNRRIQVPAAHELFRLLEKSPGRFLDHLEQYVYKS